MQLRHTQVCSLDAIAIEARKIIEDLQSILRSVDAHSAVEKINKWMGELTHTYLLMQASDPARVPRINRLVNISEDTVELFKDTFDKAHKPYAHMKNIFARSHQCSARIYRLLWEQSMSEADVEMLNTCFNDLNVSLNMWLDTPSDTNVLAQETHGFDGRVLFTHCYGYTFIDYERSSAVRGWSVLIEPAVEAFQNAKRLKIKPVKDKNIFRIAV